MFLLCLQLYLQLHLHICYSIDNSIREPTDVSNTRHDVS